jgi:protocatechuate 3,4-dioxygenase beta subunit
MGTLAILAVAIAAGAQAPAASVSGRITDAASGRPVPRMIVAAVGADRIAGVEAVTDDEGRYEIAGLTAGAYAIRVTNDEHRSTYLPQWFGEPGSASLFGVPPRLNVAW